MTTKEKEVTDRNQTRDAIAAGGWTIAWGDLINEGDVIEGAISVYTNTVPAFVTQQITVQVQKFRQNLNNISHDVVDQAISFAKSALLGRRNEERDINGLGVKAGLATYHRHMEYWLLGKKVGSHALPNNYQPYIGVRVTKPLPTKDGSTPAPVTSPEPSTLSSNAWYKMKNTAKPGMSIDVINDGNQQRDGQLHMAADGDFSGQYWQLRPSPVVAGAWNLSTMWLGTNMSLDVYGDDKTRPHLTAAGRFSGQQWHIVPNGDGTWQLTNTYSGPLVLTADANGSQLSLRDAQTASASRWVLHYVRQIT